MSIKDYCVVIIVALSSFAVACGHFTPQTEPGREGVYKSFTLKMNIKARQENRKGNGKILWFFDRHRGKMLFLSPLNQVYFELLVEKEKALLISRKEKKYWQGKFKNLLKRLWNLEVEYNQLQELLETGEIPHETGSHSQLIFNIEKDQDTGQPLKIEISNKEVDLKFRITKKNTKSGLLKLEPNLTSLQRVGLEEILSLQY